MTKTQSAQTQRKIFLPLALVVWTILLLAAHGYWMATYTGGVIQEDTAILNPAVEFLRLRETKPWTTAILGYETHYWRDSFVTPYLMAFLVYPPLPSLVVAGSIAWFGALPNAPFLPVMLYLPLLVLGTFLLARRFLGPVPSAAAAAIAPLFPGCFYLQRQLYAAYPMTVVVTFALWAWWRSERLARPGRAVVFGLLAGALLLVKHTASVFLVAPALWTLFELGRDLSRDRSAFAKRLGGSVLALVTAAAVAALWYVPALRHLSFTLGFQALRGVPEFEFLYYPRLIAFMLGPVATVAAVVALAGLAYTAYRREVFRSSWAAILFFASWIVVPVTIFSFLPVVNMEVMLPILPAMAIVIAAGAARLPRRWMWGVQAGLAVILAVLFVRTLDVYGLPFEKQLYEPRAPGTDANYETLVTHLKELTADVEAPMVAVVPFADYYVSDMVLNYYAFRHGFKYKRTEYWFDHLCGDNDPEAPAQPAEPLADFALRVEGDAQFKKVLGFSDVLLLNLRDKPLRDHERHCPLAQAVRLVLEKPEYQEVFKKRGVLTTPSGSEIHIHQATAGRAAWVEMPPVPPPGQLAPPPPPHF
ncbi:MAG: glycosyltransferase family 39 protein [Candidatus Lernaella stagnicola]|nr:glycosyltransferase family 39 protein [Candidatus Lernaella stagnicola]